MTNAEYRKSRGTDKPFSGSEEQELAFWNERSRKERPQYRKPKSASEDTPKE